jgi:hypothetical protein
LAAGLVLAPTFASADPVKLKFAVFSADTERLYDTVKKPFAAAVNAGSGGTIKLELYPNGALGRAPRQQAQTVLDRVADIGFIVPPFSRRRNAPVRQFFLRICGAHEPVSIQAFRWEAAVERLDERVICGLSRPGEVERDAALLSAQIQIATRTRFVGRSGSAPGILFPQRPFPARPPRRRRRT